MLVSRLRAIAPFATATALLAVGACSGSHAASAPAPPRAEFLLSSTDSTFWITTVSGAAHIRGAPLVLARYNNRFFELYSADDDHSYNDALLVGERLYRRDLITGDSAVMFADTAVSHVAAIYARTHPDERPLGPDEEGEANPQTSATAQLDILDVFGPFLSYEYHVDIDLPGKPPWHSTRRGVLDLRTGKQSEAGDLFGSARGRELTSAARQAYEAERDSALRARNALSGNERKALAALEQRQFDPRCFALESVDGQPAITFGIPGAGEGAAGNIVELDPITVDSVSWWRDASAGLARRDANDVDHWTARTYSIIARYDTSGQFARLSIADASKREWLVGSATGPLRRIDWLDQPPPSDLERTALRRAFDQAARYDENARVATRGTSSAKIGLVAFRQPPPAVRHVRGHQSSMKGGPNVSLLYSTRHQVR
jgi:hypothetical protein